MTKLWLSSIFAGNTDDPSIRKYRSEDKALFVDYLVNKKDKTIDVISLLSDD